MAGVQRQSLRREIFALTADASAAGDDILPLGDGEKGRRPYLMIGSAADIDFNTFVYHMGGLVFAAWIVILFFLKILFRIELAEVPADEDSSDREAIVDP